MRPQNRHYAPVVLSLSLVLVASACARKPAPAAPAPSAPVAAAATTTPAGNGVAERERVAREAADREARAREDLAREAMARNRASLAQVILFDLDQSDLTQEARAILDVKLGIMRAEPTFRIRIDGHADERGSTEYNLALGMARAQAARRYLTQRDISADRIEITSFGEERPLCTTSDESCWRSNRRAESVVVTP